MEGNMLYYQYLRANSEYFGKQEMAMNMKALFQSVSL
ncbi:hypothetical protein DEU43_10734 [Bacillus amyloliquefaciens]|nr:hypothetical protein DEU43_10734 [Bacillus amyloliquefaciens]